MRSLRWTVALATLATLAATAAPAAAGPTGVAPGHSRPATLHGLDLDRATVLDLQDAMDRHRLTAVTLTAFYLHRIAQLNPALHAVIETNPDALREAQASDRYRRTHGRPRGPLEGVPVLLKDNVDTADAEHTTAGSLALVDARPAADATLVTRLRAAGAVIIGKANLSEWANFRDFQSSSGWSARGGQTNNPYVLDRNPCGSSSGSAVAAAADLAAVAIGTETDGSIVCPSGANGVVGIKPTLGLVSRAGVIPISAEQDTAGPITRTVTDAAAVLSVIQGVDARDPATLAAGPFAGRGYLSNLDAGALHGRRIGIWRDAAYGNADALAQLDRTAAVLRARGATVVDPVVLPDLDEVYTAEFAALLTEFKHDINAYLAGTPGRHPADLAGLIAFNQAHAAAEMPYFGQGIFEAAQATTGDLDDPAYRQDRRTATDGARAAIDDTMRSLDLSAIVGPSNGPAWVTDLRNGDDFSDFAGSSGPAAIAGYPDLAVPAGYTASGLPLGVSFFGGRFSEPTMIALAYAYEQATRVRVPPGYLPSLAGTATAPARGVGAGVH